MRANRILLILCLLLSLIPIPLQAQTETPPPPDVTPESTAVDDAPIPLVHVVEEGENLTYIAGLYDTTVAELEAVNGLVAADVLFVGQSLTIPGGEGEAIATVYSAGLGDTLAGMAPRFNTEVSAILATNNLIYPDYDLQVGQTIALISRSGSALPAPVTGIPHVVAPGESLLMLAAKYGFTSLALATANDLPYPGAIFAGQRLRIPYPEIPYHDLPGEWVDVDIRPYPLVAGQTASLYVENILEGRPSGEFAGKPLRFTLAEEGFVALIALDAFTEPGSYPLTLTGSGNRPWSLFQETVSVRSGNYGTQFITVSEELNALLAPSVRAKEDEFLTPIYAQYGETQAWEGLFQLPLTTTVVTAAYGDARSYNGGPIEIFHTGVDFGASVGTPVYAAAAGVVAYSGALDLRGNVVILDHGLGVMTAYFHLSESLVIVGEPIVAGQVIATVGSTGLSSGPHLHWDLRIMDVPVNGLQWTEEQFP